MLPTPSKVLGSGAQANIEACGGGSPARPAKRFDQRVAALAVGVAHFLDAIVRPVQRGGGGDGCGVNAP